MPIDDDRLNAEETAADTLIGSVLEERYRIDAYLARGGMSTVYRGVDLRLERPVAVKVMTPQYAADATFLARFEREARAAAKLDNPHVVGVYDQGRDGEHVFLVMELVDGGTLRDLLRDEHQLSVRTALSVLEPVLDALAAAHRAGLVHRDVKPENVLISRRGEVKVADFGLVRAVTSTTMATGDVILGTVAYLSPEQVETGASDERSDVYSAGIVAYEMLTGAPPFGGDNALSVAYQHVHSDVPSVARDAPGVPEEIVAAIDAATSRDPLGRPPTADDLLRTVRAARSRLGLALAAVPIPTPHAHKQRTGARQATSVDPSAGSAATRVATRRTAQDRSQSASRDQPRGRPPRRRRWRGRLIAIGVVIVLGVAAALGGRWLAHRWTSAPAVVDQPSQAAISSVRHADLVPTVTTRYDNTVPSGRVAAMTPSAEVRQRRGATITLVVSAGKPEVPKIHAGASVKEASATIRSADLKPVTDEDHDVFSETVAKGAVVRTQPTTGVKARIGSEVVLVVSKGPRPESVPTVAGKKTEDAQNKLLVAGFAIGPVKTVFNATVPPGTVIGTDPPAGKQEPRGSTISLVLAASKTVPDVGTSTVDAAVDTLEDDGFDVTIGDPVFDAEVPGDDVVRLEPPAGTRVDPDDPAVTVIGSNAITVPSMKGKKVRDAKKLAASEDLKISVSSLFGSDGARVTGQRPEAGTLVEPNSTVHVDAWP